MTFYRHVYYTVHNSTTIIPSITILDIKQNSDTEILVSLLATSYYEFKPFRYAGQLNGESSEHTCRMVKDLDYLIVSQTCLGNITVGNNLVP